MDVKQFLAQHLLDVHNADNWTDVNIENTLADVTFVEAMTVTSFTPNTIAMLFHHISFSNRVVAQRAAGIMPVIEADNGFHLPPLKTEADWQALKQDNIRSAEELAAAIRAYDTDFLEKPILPKHSSAYKTFAGNTEHIHYHLGEIVMVKKAVRARAENEFEIT